VAVCSEICKVIKREVGMGGWDGQEWPYYKSSTFPEIPFYISEKIKKFKIKMKKSKTYPYPPTYPLY